MRDVPVLLHMCMFEYSDDGGDSHWRYREMICNIVGYSF